MTASEPTPRLSLRELTDADLEVIQFWMQDHESLLRMGGLLPLRQWYGAVTRSPHYFAWMAEYEGEGIGMSCVELYEGGRASIGVLINPAMRARRLCAPLVADTMRRANLAGATEVWAHIDRGNTPSIRCFRRSGFVDDLSAQTEEGMIALVWRSGAGDQSPYGK